MSGLPSARITTAHWPWRRCVSIQVIGGSLAGVLLLPPVESGEYIGELFARAAHTSGATESAARTGRHWTTRLRSRSTQRWSSNWLRSAIFTTKQYARRAVAGWIDEYNTVGRHSTDQMLSSVDYEPRHPYRTSRGMTGPADDAPRHQGSCNGDRAGSFLVNREKRGTYSSVAFNSMGASVPVDRW